MFPFILVALAVVVQVALAAVLVRRYLRTRDVGFVWLAGAVGIWPLISRIIEQGEKVLIDRVVQGQLIGLYPFSLVERGEMSIGGLVMYLNLLQQLIGVGLLFIAVLYLCKTKRNGNLQAA